MNNLPSLIRHNKICVYAYDVKPHKSIRSVQYVSDSQFCITSFSLCVIPNHLKLHLKIL